MGKQDNEFSQIQRRICSLAITYTTVLALFFVLFDKSSIAKGLLLGMFFSIINFILIGKSIPMTLKHSRPKAGLIGLISILCRYIILAIPMVVAVKSASFNFVAVVVGIFAIQIVTLFEYVIKRPVFDEK